MKISNILKLASVFEIIAKDRTKKILKEWMNPVNWDRPQNTEHVENEDLLLKHKIMPIVRPTAINPWLSKDKVYTSTVGSGAFTKVYEVTYQGKRAVAKITNSEQDVEAYRKIMDIYKSAPEKIKKHLPRVYNIIKDGQKYIILTEYLIPLSPHVKSVLYTPTPSRKNEKELETSMFGDLYSSIGETKPDKYKAPDVSEISKIINDSYHHWSYQIDNIIDDLIKSDLKDEFYNELRGLFSLGKLRNKFKLAKEELIDLMSQYVFYYLNHGSEPAATSNNIKQIIADILNSISPDLKPTGKLLLDRHIDIIYEKLIKNINETFFGIDFPAGQYASKETIDFYESLPETKSLIEALKILKNDFDFKWEDLHSANLMERPDTREIVVADPGCFRFMPMASA